MVIRAYELYFHHHLQKMVIHLHNPANMITKVDLKPTVSVGTDHVEGITAPAVFFVARRKGPRVLEVIDIS